MSIDLGKNNLGRSLHFGRDDSNFYMTPDLSQGLMSTLYLTFSHNQLVIAYVTGVVISAFMAFKHPSRFYLLLLLGFAILAFNFEYDKHIIDGLRTQTMNAIVADPGKHFKAQRFISLVITELVPVGLYILGWGTIFLAIISRGISLPFFKNDSKPASKEI